MPKGTKCVFLSLFIFASCNQQPLLTPANKKEIEIGVLKMNIPSSDSFVRGNGIDSYVAYLINAEKDTFHIEYGKNSIIYDLFDVPPKGLPLKDKETLQKQLGKLPSSKEVVFTNTPEKDNEQNIFQENFYMYDTINGLIVKIVHPKKIGQGMTGMYISDLPDGNGFSIYAKNLDSSSHKEALQFFTSIKYK